MLNDILKVQRSSNDKLGLCFINDLHKPKHSQWIESFDLSLGVWNALILVLWWEFKKKKGRHIYMVCITLPKEVYEQFWQAQCIKCVEYIKACLRDLFRQF